MKTNQQEPIQQDVPDNLKESEFEQYATSFFGYGSWNAPCWVMGLEEKGAATRDEFQKRFKAWKEFCQARGKSNCRDGLADLKDYSQKSGITPDPHNHTWRAIHAICAKAVLKIGQLCELNDIWGGKFIRHSKPKPKSKFIALLEAMPFPAQQTSDKEWPYKNWPQKYKYMRTKKSCVEKFLCQRLCAIAKRIEEHKPTLVIVYGDGGICLRQIWQDLIRQMFCKEWCQHTIRRKRTKKPRKKEVQIQFLRNGGTRLVIIPHPTSYAYFGRDVAHKIESRISELMKTAKQ